MSESLFQLTVPRLFIAGVSSNCGAEQLALAIVGFLKEQGLSVSIALFGTNLNLAQLFREQTGHLVPCLEPQLETFEQILADLYLNSLGSQIQIICSPYGFFDGSTIGSFSNSPAEIAIRTATPTILCLDSNGYGNGVIPLIKGFKGFATGLNLAGIFNLDMQHEKPQLAKNITDKSFPKLIEQYFPNLWTINIKSGLARNFNLPKGIDYNFQYSQISRDDRTLFYKQVVPQLNRAKLLEIAGQAGKISVTSFNASPQKTSARLAVALDSGFNLLYQNNLAYLRYLGIELVPFSPLVNKRIPSQVSGVYLPGVTTLDYWKDLAQEKSFQNNLQSFMSQGGVCLAEGSALTLFSKNIQDTKGQTFSGWGILDFDCKMHTKEENIYFSEAHVTTENILGEVDVPSGFCLQTNFTIRDSNNANQYLQEQKTDHIPADGQTLKTYSPSAQSLLTNGYLNFSTNPLIALNLVSACKTAQLS